MATTWENSFADRIAPHSSRPHAIQQAVAEVRQAIESLTGPDAAKVLTAIAADVLTGIHRRNDRSDVSESLAALLKAAELVDSIGGNLDG
jgi:hypothetical protein